MGLIIEVGRAESAPQLSSAVVIDLCSQKAIVRRELADRRDAERPETETASSFSRSSFDVSQGGESEQCQTPKAHDSMNLDAAVSCLHCASLQTKDEGFCKMCDSSLPGK